MTDYSKSYDDYQQLYDGHLTLYTRAGSKSPNWYARITLPNMRGDIRRSLKTTSESEAIFEGKKLYLELRAKYDQHIPLDSLNFHQLSELYLEDRALKRRVRSSHKEYHWVIENFLNPFFNPDDFPTIHDIGETDIAGYFAYRERYWVNHSNTPIGAAANREPTNKRRYSKSAANREAIILRNVLRWARDKGYLGRLPKVEYPDHLQEPEKVRGGIFTETDWRRYIALLVHDIKRQPDPDKLRYHIMIVRRLERLRFWSLLLISSGIRPQEAKQLKQKQIFSRVDPATGHTFTCIDITKEQSKNGRAARRVITDNFGETYKYFQRYLRVLYDYDPKFIGDDKLIFPSFRRPEEPFDQMSALRRYLKSLNLHLDDDGAARTSYSFRSFYITKQLEHGVPLYVVAHNAGTSTDMILKHYAKSMTWTMRSWLTASAPNWLKNEIEGITNIEGPLHRPPPLDDDARLLEHFEGQKATT
mgnify:CR=1 FL=1